MNAPQIGESLTRVDGLLKVTGKAQYAGDFTFPQIAYGVVIQSAIASGTISGIDLSFVKNAPGVIDVLTKTNLIPLDSYPEGLNTNGVAGEKRTPLQDDNVYWQGQPIGVVIADTFERATYAARLARVNYVPQVPLLDLTNPDIDSKATTPPTWMGRDPLQYKRGDVYKAWAEADSTRRIEVTYSTPVENHNTMEPCSTIAFWENNDRVWLHDSTRWIKGVQLVISKVFKLSPNSVNVIDPFVGGAFGSKGFLWEHFILALASSRLVKRPVKLILTRPQMFVCAGQRAATQQQFAIAANNNGELTSLRHETLTHCSPISEYTEACGKYSNKLYKCENVSVSHKLVHLNLTSPCPMRAPGEAPGQFASECALDELAYKLQIDPIEFRLRNYAEVDPSSNLPWSSKKLRECYTRGAQIFDWSKRKPEPGSQTDENGWLVGLGMATMTYPAVQQPAGAKASLFSDDGRVEIRSATHEIGTGTYTTMSQIAANFLGLPLDKVHFFLGDSSFPTAPPNGGSYLTSSVGPAVLSACANLKTKLAELASTTSGSPLQNTPPDQIDWNSGFCVSKNDPNTKIAFQDLLTKASMPVVETEAFTKAGPDMAKYSTHSFGAVFADVRVHPDITEFKVKRVVSVLDIGTLLNPTLATSQLIGGIIFAMGMTFFEQTIADPNIGRLVNPNLAEYLVPVNADTGVEFNISFLNEPDPIMADLGARGLGEIPMVGTPAAFGNAIFNATGRRVRDLPITIDKLL